LTFMFSNRVLSTAIDAVFSVSDLNKNQAIPVLHNQVNLTISTAKVSLLKD
jgi:hypothetical protein